MKRRFLVGGGVGLLACLGVASVRFSDAHDRSIRVFAERVSRRDIQRTLAAAGALDARVKIQISSPVVGRIERLYVREGDSVRAGQRLVDLDKATFLAQREGARAQVEIARAYLAQAEIDLQDAQLRTKRLQRLFAESIASEEQRESAQLRQSSGEIACRAARERLRQAESERDRAEEDLAKSSLWSPLTGFVTHLAARPGEVVVSGTLNNPASVIGTIADLSDLVVEAGVEETEIADVKAGQTVTIHVDALAGKTFPGRVTDIGSAGIDRSARPDVAMFPVKIALGTRDAAMRPGMSVRVRILTAWVRHALTVPLQAVLSQPADARSGTWTRDAGSDQNVPHTVFVVEKGRAAKRRVRIGLSDPTQVEILDGIRSGEIVITGPYRALQTLSAGDRVQTAPVAESESPPEAKEPPASGR